MVFEMQVEGFSALEEELDALSKAAGKGVLRRALKTSAEPMAKLMRLAAPRGDGDLVESIAVSDKMTGRLLRCLWGLVRCHRRITRSLATSTKPRSLGHVRPGTAITRPC